jgi:hypothetical protein
MKNKQSALHRHIVLCELKSAQCATLIGRPTSMSRVEHRNDRKRCAVSPRRPRTRS